MKTEFESLTNSKVEHHRPIGGGDDDAHHHQHHPPLSVGDARERQKHLRSWPPPPCCRRQICRYFIFSGNSIYPDLEFYQVEYFIPTPELDLHSLSFFRLHISSSEQKHLRETSGHYSRASAHILVTLGNLVGLMGEIHNFLLYSAFLRLDG